MNAAVVIITSLLYLSLLFLVAYYAERREAQGRSIVRNALIYALSLAVYCTAWTFYGSVGRAVTAGAGFLPIYLGPTLLAPVWWLLLRKMIRISKAQRITSVADFLSSRYGKSTSLGIVATLVAVFGIVPYISIQLKAIVISFDILTNHAAAADTPFHLDSSLYVAIALAVFTILFGTRHLDPNERHEGLVAAIALESIVKLAAFLAVGIFVTFGIFRGFGDVFAQGAARADITKLFALPETGIDGWSWFWLMLISMFAIILLPRQFHVAVVENTDAEHVGRASWLFPLYLLLINLFVLPIAIGGVLIFQNAQVEPDTFVLSIPLAYGKEMLALFVAIGGFSAATSMVITAVIALSIMISNNVVLPSLLRLQGIDNDLGSDLTRRLIAIRRVSIIGVLLLAYLFFRAVSLSYSLVSIGLMSFVGIAQFAPGVLVGMYWKRATKAGALAGLCVGFVIWVFTLPLPTLAEIGLWPPQLLENGAFGLAFLQPYALFGLSGMDPIAHAAFWSLLGNSFTLLFVSLYTSQNHLEIAQADVFVDIDKYAAGSSDYEVMRRRAKVKDLTVLLHRFLGEGRATEILSNYETLHSMDLRQEKIALPDLVSYAEIHLSGAIGAASAKVIIASIAKEDPISLEEMFNVLEQTREIMQYSKALERKSAELEQTTAQLQLANERLQELDRLKADFITTVTHELRTPITSIKSLAKILSDHKSLPETQQLEFLNIINTESERIARLINQVLDLEKIQTNPNNHGRQPTDLNDLVGRAFQALQPMMAKKNIESHLVLPDVPIQVLGHPDRLTQVVVNLLSNAIKFCDAAQGKINVSLQSDGVWARLSIQDNGRGIHPQQQQMIFEKFTQVSDAQSGKPKGSGLGLYITRTIVEQHGGSIRVTSAPEAGATFMVTLPEI
ncbi:MAG TPA: sensor histidine kinase [Saprospiraceae bacterium]|nr:sensor histidine kinase [Saprospiraceae bacterium]HMP24952.1 sensor histidine kinase [Saprospiraceae bacterium]